MSVQSKTFEKIEKNSTFQRVLGKSQMISLKTLPVGTLLELKILELPGIEEHSCYECKNLKEHQTFDPLNELHDYDLECLQAEPYIEDDVLAEKNYCTKFEPKNQENQE